jgi:hypothetical protein
MAESQDALTWARPATLEDVAARTLKGEAFDPLLREFLDEFYLADGLAKAAAVARAPAPIAPIQDAYLGAVAEHLALKYELPIPSWTEEPHRFLARPFFAGGLEDLKAILLVESPLAFRRRQIFVSANALSRPRESPAPPPPPAARRG